MPRVGDVGLPRRAYSRSGMDTIRTLTKARHFFTADLRLAGFGQVVLIGDRQAVERIVAIVAEHAEHDLVPEPELLDEDR